MKVCIFVKGASNRGKSTAITELARNIGIQENSSMWFHNGLEIRGIHNLNNVNIALCSQGDPGCGSIVWIRKIAIDLYHCDVIVAACRRGGLTQDPILPYLRDMGYVVIEVSPLIISAPVCSIPEYKTLARAIAQQILYIIKNRNRLISNN